MAAKKVGDLDGAVLALQRVLDRQGEHAGALAQLADVQVRRGRLDEAEETLDRAERAGKPTAFTARVRGDVAYRHRRWEDAARAYSEADAFGERGSWALLQLGRCRMRLGDHQGARGAAQRAVERDGSSAAWTLLGDLATAGGRLEDAETMYGRAHDRSPSDQWAYAKLVETRLLRLSPERREREISVLLKTVGRDNRHLMGVVARLRSEAGDDDQAAETWETRALQHGDPFARKMYAFALRKAGRLDEAAPVLGRCLLDDPQNVILFRAYVHTQHARGAFDDLRSTLEALLPLAGSRRGAVYGELRKLPAPVPAPQAPR